MKNNRILAVAVVAVMACAVIPIAAMDGADSNADSVATYGSFNFWFNYGSGWSSTPISGDGYNACIALKDACESEGISLSFMIIDDLSADEFVDDTGSYDTINSNYGKVDSINGSATTSTQSWYAYCYVNGAWSIAQDAIGFYKPFSDYDSNFRTANMAFYYGDEAADASGLPTGSSLAPVITVPQTSTATDAADFAVTFHIKLAYTEEIYGTVCDHVPRTSGTAQAKLTDGIEVTGYGSDAALALKNAMGALGCSDYSIYTDVSSLDDDGNVVINTDSYGYCTKLFGIYENSEDNDGDGWDDEYWYWSLYLGDGTDSYASFLMGWYSPLPGAESGFSEDEFTIHYDHSKW